MASDIKLNDNGVVVEGDIHSDGPAGGFSFTDRTLGNAGRWVLYAHAGLARLWSQVAGDRVVIHSNGNVGIGTAKPARPLHVEGNEIHSGGAGAGFSFSDRAKPTLVDNPQNGERWVWYAQDGKARLWSGGDVLAVNRDGKSWATNLEGKLFVEKDLFVHGTIRGTIRVDGTILGRDIGPKKNIHAVQFEANGIQLAPNATDNNPHFALYHELNARLGTDLLIVNYENSYKQGVKVEGNLQVTGALTHASSITLKENVAQLSSQDAVAALQGLTPVTFRYKADEQKAQHVGFIAEDVPDLVAKMDHKAVSTMDIVAVLTKVVQEQQKTITDLAAEVSALKTHRL